jgi:hypothetical protein
MRITATAVFIVIATAFLSLMLPEAALAGGATQVQINSPVVGTGTVTVVILLPKKHQIKLGGPFDIRDLVVTDHNGHNIPITPSPVTDPNDPIPNQGYFSFHTNSSTKEKYQLTPLPLTVAVAHNSHTLEGVSFTFNNTSIGIPVQCPCGNKVPDGNPPFNKTCSSAQQPFGQPDLDILNGSNFVEATLNVPSGNNEAVDISCVQGANSTLNVVLMPNGNGNWYDGRNSNVTSIQNSWVDVRSRKDGNCTYPANSGVYPYGLTRCTTADSTGNALGACPNFPMPQRIAYCDNQTSNTCVLQRNPGVSGGIVLINYMGEITPPGEF